jgi:hypothetical protein
MTTVASLSASLLTTVTLMALAGPRLQAIADGPPTIAPGRFHVLVSQPVVRQRLELALRGAAERLGGSECQKVFTDFRDGAGQPLQSKLDALQKTGAEFLTWLRFSEGGGLPMCERNPHVAAFTQPGSRVVQVCGAAFAPRSVRDPLANEVLIIHELLHTLGLEENPPSSAEISRGVLVRCAAEHHFNPSATYKSDSERR